MSLLNALSQYSVYLKPALIASCAVGACRFLYSILTRSGFPKWNLRDKTVVITGASQGIGRSLAFEFHKNGAKVILLARSLDKLKELATELQNAHPQNNNSPEYQYLDLANPNGMDEVVKLSGESGQIDILINNAGFATHGSCADTTMETYKQSIEVNYLGHVAVTHALLPFMSRGATVVCVNSVQGKFAIPYRSAYGAAKHATLYAKQKGYIKLNDKKWERDFDKVKRAIAEGFNDTPNQNEIVQFIQDNAYLVGGFAGGFLVGLGIS